MQRILKTFLIALTCLYQTVSFSQSSLLWNPGPQYRAGVHANNSNGGKFEILQISETYELSTVGSPIGWSAPVLCGTPPSPLPAGNAQSPSYYHVTEGWKSTEFGLWPGWAVYHMSGGAGNPIETRLLSNSFASTDPCTLREVSQTYKHFSKTNFNTVPPNLGFWSFKQEYSLGSFAQLYGSFDARLNRTLETSKMHIRS